MKISAVIPTFNRPRLTAEAIRSVIKQTRPADEIVVVDDGSTDNTPAVLDEFDEKITVIRKENSGVSAARNTGIRRSSGKWIAFLDSDDLWLPDKLKKQEQAALAHPEAGVIHTDEKWIKDGAHKNQGKRHQKYSGMIYEHCLPLCAVSPSSAMVRRSVFNDVGLFDEDLPACEDYDMWLRICSRFSAVCVQEKLTIKRAGIWKQLSDSHSLDRYRIIALRKALDGQYLTEEQVEATIEMLREKIRVYALGCRKHGREDEAIWAEGMY